MRLITYSLKNAANIQFVGVEKGGVVIDIEQSLKSRGVTFPSPFTMRGFLELGSLGLRVAAEAASQGLFATPLDQVIIKAPISDPHKLICVGMNYVDHCLEQNAPIPKEPVIFSKFPNSIISPNDDLVVTEGHTQELDYEVELAIVIGVGGKGIPKEKAMQHVVGYSTAHDVSARDWQLKRNGGQWLLGKTADCFAPLGPAIVTTDELKDPHNLGIRCYLNGKEVQNSNTSQLVFKTEAIVEWVSKYTTLQPGDVILTGTPPGVGCFRKPQLFLKHGDVVKCEIDGIGAISNTVKIHPLRYLPCKL